METLSRRQALLRLAAIGGGVALSATSPILALAGQADEDDESRERERDDRRLPRPDQSQIEHIVVVMMENRSFDHVMGWLPDANGRQAGLRFADAQGVFHSTHHLAPDFQGCAFSDPDHSFNGGRVEYDNGKCDGWLRAGKNDVFSIGYYNRDDLPFLGHIAPRFTSPDRYFCAILGPTFPNRFFQHSAQTDRLSNTLALSTLPTIWDRLAGAGVSHRYYFSDLPFLGLWGAKYVAITAPFPTFLSDAAGGTLPAVSYIDPAFVGEDAGTSNDDHPHGDLRNGEVFLNKIYQAVTEGPGWRNTMLVINFDEWGGFFDHVPPPVGAVTDLERTLGYTDGLRGFRVPCVVISPWSQTMSVPHGTFDHTSILKMIEWRFGLPALSVRDAAARNLAHVLDFDHRRLEVPEPSVPQGPFAGCPPAPAAAAVVTATSGMASEAQASAAVPWLQLREMSRAAGFAV